MKKQEQKIINEYAYQNYLQMLETMSNRPMSLQATKLRNCQAKVFEFGDYYVLQSYNSFVAFIKKSTGELFDVLRYVYGYTATSAQHISKFAHDYEHTTRQTYKTV